MAKGVLGNDPFQRGAAVVKPAEPAPAASSSEQAPKRPAEAGVPARPSPAKKTKQRAKGPRGSAEQARGAQGKAGAPRGETTRSTARAAPTKTTSARGTDAGSNKDTRTAKKKTGSLTEPAQSEGRTSSERATTTQAAAPDPAQDRGPTARRTANGEPQTRAPAAHHASEQPPRAHVSAATMGADAVLGLPPDVHPVGAGNLTSTALTLGKTFVSRAAASSTLNGLKNTASGVVRALQTALGTAGASELDDYGKDPALEAELSRVAAFFYETWWRVQVDGAALLPRGPAIVVANHSGAMPFDGPVLHAALRRERPELAEPRWLIEDQLFYAPFLGTLLNRIGAVRANPDNALRLLSEGRPVIVFPEGLHGISKPYSERYRLMRFGRGGFVKLALRARVPIVPVAIVGAEEASPLVARLPAKFLGLPYLPITSPIPLPSRWRIRVGEPIQVDELAADGREDLLLVNRLNERTRETIQGMLEAMLKSRAGVFS